MLSGLSSPRPTRRRRSSSTLGGSMKTSTKPARNGSPSGSPATKRRTEAAPTTSMSISTLCPSAMASRTGPAGVP